MGPWTAGKYPVKTSVACSILFINQKIQNNHHSANAQAPRWPPHPPGHTLLSRAPTLLPHFLRPGPGTVLGEAGAGLEAEEMAPDRQGWERDEEVGS